MNLTLIELHLPDAEFNAPFSRQSHSPDAEPATDREPAASDESSSTAGPFVLLLALAGLGLLARYLRGGEAEQATLDEIEA